MDKIINAKDKTNAELSSGLPSVEEAIEDTLSDAVAVKIVKNQIDGRTVETSVGTPTKAALMPFSAQALRILPEGQRAWRWFTAYALANIDLKPDDGFIIKGVPYRIIEKFDWSAYGYFKYNVIEDYDLNAPEESNDG